MKSWASTRTRAAATSAGKRRGAWRTATPAQKGGEALQHAVPAVSALRLHGVMLNPPPPPPCSLEGSRTSASQCARVYGDDQADGNGRWATAGIRGMDARLESEAGADALN